MWLDRGHADAPPYGTRVITDSLAALADLERASGARAARVKAAINLIVDAQRTLAEGSIGQAKGANPRLLAAAKHALGAGIREASDGRPRRAVRSYGRAWGEAFAALTRMVSATLTRVTPADLAASAENALGSPAIGLAGPRILPAGARRLVRAGKPELLYIGSEACPFCGVERWGMIVALSQFGHFSNLQLMQSSAEESPHVATLTFFGSRYRSSYVSFVPVEAISNVPKGRGFAHLQPLSRPEKALLKRFDSQTETPFVDVGGRFVTSTSTVQPELIRRKSWTQLSDAIADPSSTAGQAIGGEAEVLTAEICRATGGKPRAVCSAAVVQQYEAALPQLNGQGGGCSVATTSSEGRQGEAKRMPAQRPWALPHRCVTH
ncbi:MAG TPA: DUF929 family protein [Solirubrobacteraceae bacterium]|nr:DUF929 family protein [Solirubrobacteraceae bacterium]